MNNEIAQELHQKAQIIAFAFHEVKDALGNKGYISAADQTKAAIALTQALIPVLIHMNED